MLVISSSTKECGRIKSSREEVFPWTINIYQSKAGGEPKLICSGTLISEGLVLSSASCFYDDTTIEFRKEKLYLTIGHKYKQWASQTNNSIEMRQIFGNEVLKSKKYNGFVGRYTDNIAIVKLGDGKKLKKYPLACLDWDNAITDAVLEENSLVLKIIAWPPALNSAVKQAEALYVDYDECQYFLKSKNVRSFLTYDKHCMKLKDTSTIPSVGSGVFALSDNRWFLIGITSEITSGESGIYITYTKLRSHMNWISNSAYLDL